MIYKNNIGTNAGGTGARGNDIGIVVEGAGARTLIGDGTRDGRNLVSGNTSHGLLFGAGATGVVAAVNRIGTIYDGTRALANGGDGVRFNGATTNTLTENTIAYNTGFGVRVEAGTGNRIDANSIFRNTAGGISLAAGANGGIGQPTITDATRTSKQVEIQGQAATRPNVQLRIQLFGNPSSPRRRDGAGAAVPRRDRRRDDGRDRGVHGDLRTRGAERVPVPDDHRHRHRPGTRPSSRPPWPSDRAGRGDRSPTCPARWTGRRPVPTSEPTIPAGLEACRHRQKMHPPPKRILMTSVRPPRRLRVESLEHREVPAVLTTGVDNDNYTSAQPTDWNGTDDLLSLREAIRMVNKGADTVIDFDGLTVTIGTEVNATGDLPDLTRAATVRDGRLDGNGLAGGLTLSAGGTVRNMTIVRVDGVALTVGGTGAVVENNIIGTDANNTVGLGNGLGILIRGSDGSYRGNVISANTDGGVTIAGEPEPAGRQRHRPGPRRASPRCGTAAPGS